MDQARREHQFEREASESSAVQIVNLNTEISKLASKLHEKEREIENEKRLIEKNSELLEVKQIEIDELMQQLDKSNVEIEMLRAQVESFADKWRELSGENESNKMFVESLNETIENMRREWDEERKAFEEERADWAGKGRQLVESMVQLDETSSLLNKFKNSCQDLENKNAELAKVLNFKNFFYRF